MGERSDEQIHAQIFSQLATLKQRVDEMQHEHPITIHITDNLFIGGFNMAKLNTVALNAALTKNTSLGDVLDSIFDAIVEAINGANGQAEIDALTAKLESDNFREEARVAALKGLVTPAPATLTAVWNGPTTASVGAAFTGAVAAAGGTAPYSYTQDSGALPDGVTFSGDTASGAPGTAGDFTFGGNATDAAGATAAWSATITIS